MVNQDLTKIQMAFWELSQQLEETGTPALEDRTMDRIDEIRKSAIEAQLQILTNDEFQALINTLEDTQYDLKATISKQGLGDIAVDSLEPIIDINAIHRSAEQIRQKEGEDIDLEDLLDYHTGSISREQLKDGAARLMLTADEFLQTGSESISKRLTPRQRKGAAILSIIILLIEVTKIGAASAFAYSQKDTIGEVYEEFVESSESQLDNI